MYYLALIFSLFFISSAHSVTLQVTSTTRQDQGGIYACTKATKAPGETCTAQEAKDFAEARFNAVLDNWADQKEWADLQTQGVGLEELKKIALDGDISLANKCAVMVDKGLQVQFEAAMSVTCP